MGANRRTRIIAIIATPIIVVGLVVVLLAVFGTPQDASPTQDSARSLGLEKTLTLAPTGTPGSEEAEAMESVPTEIQLEQVVAQVNDRIIPMSFLELASAADRAITAFVGSNPATQDEIIEVLVNGELVWQQAEKDGYALQAEEVNTALENFVKSHDKTIADLEAELSAQGLKLGDFQSYFWRLLTINGYTALKSQELGITGIEFVLSLQSEARISYGPAAGFSQRDNPIEVEDSQIGDQSETTEVDGTE